MDEKQALWVPQCTLTLSEAQEALRLLALNWNLGESFESHIIRHNSLFGIYQWLLSYHLVTLVCSAFGWCSLIQSELVSASLSITQYCLVSLSVIQYHLASLQHQSTVLLTSSSTLPFT